MTHHTFSPRTVAAGAGMAALLVTGTATGAMAAVTSASAPSAQQSAVTAPGAPTGLIATAGDGQATLSWSAPSSDGGAKITDYVVEGGPAVARGNGIVQRVTGLTTTVHGLTDGTEYLFQVLAENGVDSTASTTVAVTPHGSGSIVRTGIRPSAPTGLKTGYGDDFISLSWSKPAAAGDNPVTGYHVYLGFSQAMTGAREFTTTATSYRITDQIMNGETYWVKVTAFSKVGDGPATAVQSVTPVPVHGPTPPPRPTGLTARAHHGEVILSWSPPKGGLKTGEGYNIYVGTRSGHEGAKPSIPYLIPTTSYTVGALKDGTTYYFQVTLVDVPHLLVSARSVEVSAVPGTGRTTVSSPVASAPASTPASTPATSSPGAIATAKPSGTSLPGGNLTSDQSTSGLSTGLIVLLVALALAAGAGSAAAITLLLRRRNGPHHRPVPAPRRPDEQPTERFSREDETAGPRYR